MIKTKELFLNEACKIADNLIDISFKNEKYATWLNLTSRLSFEKNHSIIEESDFSLLNGICGDAILYYTLYKINQEKKYLDFGEKLYNTLLLHLNNNKVENFQTGLLTGIGGVIYSMVLIYEITFNIKILQDLKNILEKIYLYDLIKKDENSSIVAGNAGLLISLCKYIDYSEKKDLVLKLIVACSEKLINNAVSTLDYIYWLPVHQEKPLAGIAHGASGYALAFHKAYEKTKNEQYKSIVEKIINFENTLFDNKISNWVDNRDFAINSFKTDTVAWSHGAPGIGLVRQKLLKSNLYDKNMNKILTIDLENCIKKTINSGFSNNKDILIYGKLGNLELLINQEIFFEVDFNLELMFKNSQIYGWQYGYNLKDFYLPGFFQGSSGIAYQLLRISNINIPSVLSFD